MTTSSGMNRHWQISGIILSTIPRIGKRMMNGYPRRKRTTDKNRWTQIGNGNKSVFICVHPWLIIKSPAKLRRQSSDHFVDVNKMVLLGSGAEREIEDIALTRYACLRMVKRNKFPFPRIILPSPLSLLLLLQARLSALPAPSFPLRPPICYSKPRHSSPKRRRSP